MRLHSLLLLSAVLSGAQGDPFAALGGTKHVTPTLVSEQTSIVAGTPLTVSGEKKQKKGRSGDINAAGSGAGDVWQREHRCVIVATYEY